MLPKVASLGSLQGAAVRSAWQRSSQAQSHHGRRKSLDVPLSGRPRSRASSSHDLASLDMEFGGVESGPTAAVPIPRPITPPPPSLSGLDCGLWPLVESPSTSFSPNDAMAHMAKLSASLDASRSSAPPSNPGPEQSESPPCSPIASPTSVLDHSGFHGVASVSIISPAAAPFSKAAAQLLEDTPATPDSPVPALSAATTDDTAPAAPATPPATEGKPKRKGKRVGPAARPGPDEVRLYRGTLNLDYVQELLGNLAHVQRMFRGVATAPSSTAAAAATAAARLLSRSLSRAAVRVKSSVKDANAVQLPWEALATLAEFGWVEVVTEDPEQAKLMGSVEAEVHNLVTGRAAAYHRPATDKAWWQVGESFLAPAPAAALTGSSLGGATELQTAKNNDAVEMDVLGTGGAAVAPPVGMARGKRGGLTVAGLADNLVAAGQSVMAAAGLMQQWLDEHKSAGADGVAVGVLPEHRVIPSGSPPMVVGFAAPATG